MIATKRKMLPAVMLISIGLLLIGCRDKSLIWEETVKGEYKLEVYDKPGSTLTSGRGSVELYTGMVDHFRLGKDTPIPDCTFKVISRWAQGKSEVHYTGVDDLKPHTGDVDDGKGCQGRMESEGPMVSIVFESTAMTLKDDGTVFVSIRYSPKRDDSSYSSYEYSRKSEAEKNADSDAYNATRRTFTLTGERSWF